MCKNNGYISAVLILFRERPIGACHFKCCCRKELWVVKAVNPGSCKVMLRVPCAKGDQTGSIKPPFLSS